MNDNPASSDTPKIIIDEDWKSKVEAEKEALKHGAPSSEREPSTSDESAAPASPLPPQLPPASLEVLVSMLATQASIELGQGAEPQAENAREHFAIGKHFIDLLGVLEEKTKGNVSADEAKLLDAVLHDLRMAYIRLKP
jgi:hypothetical protein